jgi:hypothetical protein
LLALDKPQEIKEKFGVGYKIMIEPQSDVITIDTFEEMKP